MTDELHSLLDASRVTPEFRADVDTYARSGEADRVVAPRHHPRVKVLRVLAQLASAEPALAVERVEIEGRAGCSDYKGTMFVQLADGTQRTFEFTWCCAWRAEQQGWRDGWGLPDQMRAAHEFGWDCFEVWQEKAFEIA